MGRDVQRNVDRVEFAATLRRLAYCVEHAEPVRIQVLRTRFTVPIDAELSIEHETEGEEQELELQLRWRRGPAPRT